MDSNVTDDEEKFINSDHVASIVNLLTKFKIRLWQMPKLSSAEKSSQTEVLIIKIYSEKKIS